MAKEKEILEQIEVLDFEIKNTVHSYPFNQIMRPNHLHIKGKEAWVKIATAKN